MSGDGKEKAATLEDVDNLHVPRQFPPASKIPIDPLENPKLPTTVTTQLGRPRPNPAYKTKKPDLVMPTTSIPPRPHPDTPMSHVRAQGFNKSPPQSRFYVEESIASPSPAVHTEFDEDSASRSDVDAKSCDDESPGKMHPFFGPKIAPEHKNPVNTDSNAISPERRSLPAHISMMP